MILTVDNILSLRIWVKLISLIVINKLVELVSKFQYFLFIYLF